ncbi:hypothetical protein J6590_082675 [Homalodisca vitripennis]|nr:hypothetical protein J6590_082675 [Homalodisca vitripennis]
MMLYAAQEFLSGTKCLRKGGKWSKTHNDRSNRRSGGHTAGEIQCANVVSPATAQTWLHQTSLIGHRLDSIQVVQEVTRKVLNSILATDLKRTFDEWQTH